jgi:hypothetical protein
MVRTVAPALALALAALACKSSKPAAPPPPLVLADAAVAVAVGVDGAAAGDPAPDDPAPTDAVDEATLRAGKRTGLGAADERPEVAVEEFAQALLTGAQPWARVVDPAVGVVELRTLDSDGQVVAATMGRRCGAEADAALARLAKAASAALGRTVQGYRLTCDNSGLGDAAPVALCSIDADDEQNGQGFDLVLVPDAVRGLRLVGITLLDATPPPAEVADAYDAELGAATRCP